MPQKFRIHIKAETDEATREELREVAGIITGMREAQKKVHTEGGHQNRKIAERYQAQADAWIDKHKIIYNAEK